MPWPMFASLVVVCSGFFLILAGLVIRQTAVMGVSGQDRTTDLIRAYRLMIVGSTSLIVLGALLAAAGFAQPFTGYWLVGR